jgi:hypothetical protein
LQKNNKDYKEEEVVILSYNKEYGNIRNREQERRSRRTVMICDERDLLLMFAIELPTKYNVLTAQS